MKKIVAFVCLIVAGVCAGVAVARVNHEVKSYSLDCTSATFNFDLFKEATSTVQLQVLVDASLVYNQSQTFSGPSKNIVVPVNLNGDHMVQLKAMWNSASEGAGSFNSGVVHFICKTTTTTITQTVPTTSTQTITNNVTNTVTNTQTQTVTLPAQTTTVTTTLPVKTVTVIKKVKVRGKTKTKIRILIKPCVCGPDERLWHGTCSPIAHGKG